MTHRPLNILFIGSVVPDTVAFRTPAFSRAGNLAQQGLLDGLTEAGAEVRTVSFQPVPAFPRHRAWWVRGQQLTARHHLISFVNVPYVKQVSLAVSVLRHSWRQVRRFRPDVLMSYNVNTFTAAPLLALSKLLRVPYIPVVYDIDVPGATVPDGPLQRLEYRWAAWLLPTLPAAVIGTDLIGRDLMPGRPTLRVEGGLHQAQQAYAPPSHAGRHPAEATFDIVFAGALETYNGVDVMLEALAALPDHVRLHIAGQGRLTAAVQAAAAQDARLIFHGLLDMEGLRALYARGDLLINHRSDQRLDSRYVFPSKLIEYLASGLPVASTLFRSLPDEYRPFLEILADESPAALAAGIRRVMDGRPAAQQRAEQAQQFVRSTKNWGVQGRRILNFLEVTR